MRRPFGSVIMTRINFNVKGAFYSEIGGMYCHQILTRVKEEYCKGEKVLYDTIGGLGGVIVHHR